MYRHHGYWRWGGGGWGGGGWRGGWGGGGWGGGPFMRRSGFPLFGGGGLGGGGNGLLGDLMAGGLGYMMGRQQGQNQQQYPPQYQQPVSQYQQYPAQAQPVTPQYQATPTPANTQNSQLAQLRLLGQLRTSGTLTDEEFQAEKQKILNGF